MSETNTYPLTAYLPALDFSDPKPVILGPVIFSSLHQGGGIEISIDKTISSHLREELLLTSLHVFYFITTFRNCYYDQAYLPFAPFTQISFSDQGMSTEPFLIPTPPAEICRSLGKVLDTVYSSSGSKEKKALMQRLLKAICYFVKSLTPAITSPCFSSNIFDGDTLISLATAFEALFDLQSKNPAPDLKQKLRPMLHLKFSKPVEIFWKWVDGFYAHVHHVIHDGEELVPHFRENPNFEVTFGHLGTKFVIYSIYYLLFTCHLIDSPDDDRYTPPHFKDILPEELLMFLWPEENLLRKISILLMQIVHVKENPQSQEQWSEVSLLIGIYTLIFERYRSQESPQHPQLKYTPTPQMMLNPHIQSILKLTDEKVILEQKEISLGLALPSTFLAYLKKLDLP